MLDVDTEPAKVVALGGASLAERIVMWQHRPAASLDCSFDRIHHNLIISQYSLLLLAMFLYLFMH